MDCSPQDQNHWNRDYYDYRICDDLSEVVLQFLSIKDKVKLQFVSKRFQKTIFQRECDLRLSDFGRNLKLCESVLKKCNNLVSIDLNEANNQNFVNNFIDLVFNYFYNLIEFKFNVFQLNDQLIEKVVHKYGSKAVTSVLYNLTINCLNSLVEIREINFNYFILSSQQLTEFQFTHLKKLWIYLYDNEANHLHTFIDNNKLLTHLNICVFISDENAVQSVLNAISNLKNLVHLQIWTEIGLNNDCFEGQLERVALNCMGLKSIESHLQIDSTNTSHLISSFHSFELLNRLNLYISYEIDFDFNINEQFSLDSFKIFVNLTHLTLKFLHSRSIGASILTDIDIILPKLQYLVIPNSFIATEEIVNSLSRLSKLKTIKMNIENNWICENIEAILKKNCPKIQSIELNLNKK